MVYYVVRVIDSDQILFVKFLEVIEVLEYRSGVIRVVRYKRFLRISDFRILEWMCSKSSQWETIMVIGKFIADGNIVNEMGDSWDILGEEFSYWDLENLLRSRII